MSGPVVVSVADYGRRLRAMLGPGGIDHWPRRWSDRAILLRAVAEGFGPGESLDERTATARIEGFLSDVGRQLSLDAVSVRRALVDEGFLDRDPAGRDYRRTDRHERRVRFEAGLPSISQILGAQRVDPSPPAR